MALFNKKQKYDEIAPDEIFLDSSNLPEFDENQFEGRIEKPIKIKAIFFLGIFFLIIIFTFVYRLADLQIANGALYKERSERNNLKHSLIFAERGVIYDRNKKELAWNIPGDDTFFNRSYIKNGGFSHVLGYVSYPQKDSKGIYYQKEFIGKDGVEKYYNDILSGEKGLKIVEVDVFGKILSENSIINKVDGLDITLSIDKDVQSMLYTYIKNLSESAGFSGGTGIIMNVNTGEILALTNFPEYDSGVLSSGDDVHKINSYINNPDKPFLNRAVSGLYTPGSTVKPFVAIAALNENLIDPLKKIFSSGEISIQNPYFPDKKTIFKDWEAHGWVDMYAALAVSSNVYFYSIGGGYEDQKGLGILNIEKYTRMFGLGELTGIDLSGEALGVIPNPQWKKKNFKDGMWRIGNTYHTAIGQYGFQITPIQLVRGISIIANDGKKVIPHLLMEIDSIKIQNEGAVVGTVQLDTKYFEIVKKGMRQAVTDGTAEGLNVSYVNIAAKTGTAEVDTSKSLVNSWITGFFPYENPEFAFVVVMEKGPYKNSIGGLYVMRQLFDWMSVNTPHYLGN